MAVGTTRAGRANRVLRFRLCSAQAEPLAAFYQRALDFRRVAAEHLADTRTEAGSQVAGRGLRVSLALGKQSLELIQFVDQAGRPYPGDSQSSDLVFQHCAIVVSDMQAAMQRLSAAAGWTPISIDGPQRLPESSGGVTAFKFRDPEGHPLELLEFPPAARPRQWQDQRGGPFLGIDHSAISVSDSARSIAFYASLGLSVSNRSLNEGPTQARLDQVNRPVVEVTALAPDDSTPHVELLCYRQCGNRTRLELRANDVAATCIVFGTDDRAGAHGIDGASSRQLLDPDGHHLSIEHTAPCQV